MRTAVKSAAVATLPLVAFIVAAALPLAASTQDFLILTMYYFLVAASWNLLSGFTGQYSFAQAGLAAFGAYLAGAVALRMNWPIWTGFVVSPVAGLAVGAALGLIALRVRGVQLSLITFAVSNAFGVFLSAAADLTGGSMGMQVPRLVDGSSRSAYLLIAGAAATLYFLFQDRLLASGFGLKMQAVRDEEAVAYGLGVNVYLVKVAAFAISAAVASFAGAFYAAYVGILAPSMVSVNEMAMVCAMAVVGGLGARYGALVGAFTLQIIGFVIRDYGAQYTLLMTSGLSLACVLFFRGGLIRAVELVASRFSKPRTPWRGAAQESVEKP
jgi:branched-chain amino acid transport system permease protein